MNSCSGLNALKYNGLTKAISITMNLHFVDLRNITDLKIKILVFSK